MTALADRPGRAMPPAVPERDEALTGALVPVAVQRWRGGGLAPEVDWAAEEVAVSLEYNGIGHAVMMATPDALEDLGLGFSLSEGIAAGAHEVLDLEVHAHPAGLRIAMQITAQRFMALKLRRRSLAGRTGCGLCGVDSLEQSVRPLAPLAGGRTAPALDMGRLAAAMTGLEQAQPLRALSGATHAAAWLGPDGALHAVREDVGRHNALDKTIGALLRAGVDAGQGAALLTSRASVEMVQKAVAAGIPVLVARSAPTALAVRRAQALGLTLVGFARRDGCLVYAHAWRLQPRQDSGGRS